MSHRWVWGTEVHLVFINWKRSFREKEKCWGDQILPWTQVFCYHCGCNGKNMSCGTAFLRKQIDLLGFGRNPSSESSFLRGTALFIYFFLFFPRLPKQESSCWGISQMRAITSGWCQCWTPEESRQKCWILIKFQMYNSCIRMTIMVFFFFWKFQ